MKKIIFFLSLLLAANVFAADISKSKLQGSFSVESIDKKFRKGFIALKGDKLYTNMLDYEHMKCVALRNYSSYDDKIVCQEDAGTPLGDVYVIRTKEIFAGKLYINVRYVGDQASGFVDTLDDNSFLGTVEAEHAFVVNRN